MRCWRRQLEQIVAIVTVIESALHLRRGLEIAIALSLAVYDAAVVACAEDLGCRLVTEDRRQAEIATQLSPPVQVELLAPEDGA
jgi:predicted nucleic acid-binding protein